jgi:dCMP deaminase
MKQKHAIAHMRAAYVYADLSYCKRRQVGCVIVKHNSIIAIGYNGTDPGEDNICEDENGDTKSCVRHAEDNALRKLTRSPNDANNSIMFVTTAPCRLCASRIVDAGVKKVFYVDVYRNEKGLEYLKHHGIEIEKLTMPE